MDIGVDLLSGLYYFNLSLVKKDRYLYALYDLESDVMYEDMSIYYIRHLLTNWTKQRKQPI